MEISFFSLLLTSALLLGQVPLTLTTITSLPPVKKTVYVYNCSADTDLLTWKLNGTTIEISDTASVSTLTTTDKTVSVLTLTDNSSYDNGLIQCCNTIDDICIEGDIHRSTSTNRE